MYLGLHAKYTVFLPDLNQIWVSPGEIFVIEVSSIKFHKIRLVGAAPIHSVGRAGGPDEGNRHSLRL
jgi:hypothetical protein